MKINISFKEFKNNHSKRKHQVLFRSRTCKHYYKVENLFKFLLAEKNSFIFESVEKGKIRGRYTIFGKNPDIPIKCLLLVKANGNRNRNKQHEARTN